MMILTDEHISNLISHISEFPEVHPDYSAIIAVNYNPKTDRYWVNVRHDSKLQYMEFCVSLDFAATHAPFPTDLSDQPFHRNDFPVEVYRDKE